MKIYTKTGDDGTTGLFGGQRVAKHSLRIEAYGTVDEANSAIGMAVAEGALEPLGEQLTVISETLFALGADLATPLKPEPKYPVPRLAVGDVERLEQWIDGFVEKLPALKHFILPGGTRCAAALHLARTICRRAERRVTELAEQEEIGQVPQRYLNRLSDYLFTASRWANFAAGVADSEWIPIQR